MAFSLQVFASRTDYCRNVQVSDELVAEYAELSNAAGSNEHVCICAP